MTQIRALVSKPFSIFTKNFLIKAFSLTNTITEKSKQSPWLNEELDKMRKTRDKNKIKVIKGLLDEKEYKEHKNKTRKMTRKAQEK